MTTPAITKKRRGRFRILRIVIFALLFALAGAAGAGYWLVSHYTSPEFIRAEVVNRLGDAIDREVSVESVESHGLNGFRIRGLSVASLHPDSPPLASIESMDIQIRPWPLLRRQLRVERLEIINPHVSFFRDEQGRLSIRDLIDGDADREKKKKKREGKDAKGSADAAEDVATSGEGSTEAPKPDKPRKLSDFQWTIENVSVHAGAMEFKDASLQVGMPTLLAIENLDLEMKSGGEAMPAPTHASFRMRYRGMNVNVEKPVKPFEVTLDFEHSGAVAWEREEYRFDTMDLALNQSGRAVGAGSLDQPFLVSWDPHAPAAQVNPAEISLRVDALELEPFSANIFRKGSDRITSGTLSGDWRAVVSGDGRVVDLAGDVAVAGLGLSQVSALDVWTALAVNFNLTEPGVNRFNVETRLIKGGHSQGKIRLRGEGDVRTGKLEGNLTVEALDLTVLGSNIAGLSRDIMVEKGVVDSTQDWRRSREGDPLSARGSAQVKDLVFRGAESQTRTPALFARLQDDVVWTDGRLTGAKEYGHAGVIETGMDGEMLDRGDLYVDLRWPDNPTSSSITLMAPTLALDRYIEFRDIARDGQSEARKARKDSLQALEELVKKLKPDTLTSATLRGADLARAPDLPARPEAKTADAGADDTGKGLIGLPPFSFGMAIDKLHLGGGEWEELRLIGRANDPRIEITRATARLGDGRLALEVGAALKPSPRQFDWEGRASQLPGDRLIKALAPEWPVKLTGMFDLRTLGHGRGLDWRSIDENLRGSFALTGRSGSVADFSPATALATLVGIPSLAKMQFEALDADIALHGIRVLIHSAKIRNPEALIEVTGWCDAQGNLDWTVELSVAGTLAEKAIKRFGESNLQPAEDGYLRYPSGIRIAGRLDKAEAMWMSALPAPK